MSKPDVTFHVPSDEFKKVLNQYAEGSNKIFRDTINSRLLDIVIKSYMKTKKAFWPAIEAKMGAIYQFGKYLKSGAFKRYKRARMTFSEEHSLAYRIVQARYKRSHGKYMKVAEAVDKAKRFVNAIKKSIGFIASGWVPALASLTVNKHATQGETTNIDVYGLNRQVRGQLKGFGRPALSIYKPMAEAGNTTKAAEPITGPAAREAFAESQANMERILRRNMEAAMKPFDGKVIK